MSGAGEDDDENALRLGRENWTAEDWERWRERFLGSKYIGPEFDQTVGQNLQRFRSAVGLTQAELAAAISRQGELIHQQTVQKIEKGQRPLRYGEALRICQALRISPAQLGDNTELAGANAHFMEVITEVGKIQAELHVLVERLAQALVSLAEMLGLRDIGSSGYQSDQSIAADAKYLIAKNWGKDLNQMIGEKLLIHPYLGEFLRGSTAQTAVEMLKLIRIHTKPIFPGDIPPDDEPWTDASDT